MSNPTLDNSTGASAPPSPVGVWRSPEERAGADGLREAMEREFPEMASEWEGDAVSRRNFLKVMGASVALAGLGSAGCSRSADEKIVPYVQKPPGIVEGKPLFYATAMPFGGYAKGILVEQHEGRPTKIEGNPDHPASLGAADIFGQASILSLYDPDRSQTLTRSGEPKTWGTFLATLAGAFDAAARRGASPRLRILTETVTSPTLAAQIKRLSDALPPGSMQWHTFDPIARDNTRSGAQLAFGSDLEPIYHFDQAEVILSLDSNFLVDEPGSLRYARDYINRRRVRNTAVPEMAQPRATLFVIETTPTLTGAMADYRLRVPPSELRYLAHDIARAVAGNDAAGVGLSGWLPQVVRALRQARGKGAVVCGEWQPPEIHALANAINVELVNVGDGKPITFIPAVEATPAEGAQSLRQLTADLSAGAVDLLLILGGNPAYAAPADIPFADALRTASATVGADNAPRCLTARLGCYADETSGLCQWHLPETHFLEQWGDARAFDGTATILQPLIAPLYASTRSPYELIAALSDFVARRAGAATGAAPSSASTQPTAAGEIVGGGYEVVRTYWRGHAPAGGAGDFDTFWHQALRTGIVKGTAAAAQVVQLRDPLSSLVTSGQRNPPAPGLTLVLRPDPCVWDGSFANNAWLAELPKPLTKITWDNAALMSIKTARELGLTDEQQFSQDNLQNSAASRKTVDLTLADVGELKGVPVWVMPGHPDGTVTLHLGYGRTAAGKVGGSRGRPVGFDAYRLRTSAAPWFAPGLQATPGGETYDLAVTQNHQVMKPQTNVERDLVRWGTAEGLLKAHEAKDAEREKTRRVPLNVLPSPTVPEHNSPLPDHPTRETSLYPDNPDQRGGHVPGYPAWAMVIDMTACIGCNACVVACQSENNIPVVGKEGVIRQREMHWIRIDTYYLGEEPTPTETFFQPVPCMHCEKAPCEVVCPVGATSHSKEGLNEMTYNRCVGTRYCSNNCPYKVRRFNFFNYTGDTPPSLQLRNNPEVSVRTRGVMEKCTYCVQRIARARIEAKKQNIAIPDGWVTTACQQTCPTEAIVFGDMSDPKSRVSALKREPTNYGLLEELQTKPRTTYLPRVIQDDAAAAHPR